MTNIFTKDDQITEEMLLNPLGYALEVFERIDMTLFELIETFTVHELNIAHS